MTLGSAQAGFEDEELLLYGENSARLLSITRLSSGKRAAKELRSDLKALKCRCAQLAREYSGGGTIPPACEWLLDNHYLAAREGAQAYEDISSARRLPSGAEGIAIEQLCRGLLRSAGSKITPARIALFFEGCQSVYVLSRRELYLLLPMLRAVIIAELAELYSAGEYDNGDAIAAERLFSALRLLSSNDLSELLDKLDRTEQLFLTDPAGVYPLMSEKTRAHYKQELERLAKKRNVNEHHLAEHVLRLSRTSNGAERHIGHYLFTQPLGEKPKKRSGAAYIAVLLTLTVLICILAGVAVKSFWAALLIPLPVYETIKTLLDTLLLRITPPAHIPRMELEAGVPVEGRTLCVITALLTSESSGAELSKRLEEYRLANRDSGENLLFGILADLPDSKSQTMPTDETLVSSAREAVSALNEKYGGGFYFFLRERVYSRREEAYMAWERKRGALVELSRLLRGGDGIRVCAGNALGLRGVKYILTLDEDTRLTPGSARELIGAMLHPLNAPVIDESRNIVCAGYGIIHPRITTELGSRNRSRFAHLLAPQGGCDPYGGSCSELYMDVFGSGGFAGKGIFDVDAFLKCAAKSIEEGRVLSHDALEGAYLRGGFMGDVELCDSFPVSLLSFHRRSHRWTRGDWQNLPWIFKRGHAFTPIDRFRLFDSIRRSLTVPAVLACIIAAFFLPSRAFTAAALIALHAVTLELILAILRSLTQDESTARVKSRSGILPGARNELLRLSYRLLFLPYEAVNDLSAVFTALWRMCFSKKHLLQWTTASALERGRSGFSVYTGAMLPSLVLSALCILSPSVLGKAAGIFWMLAPLAAYDLSRPPFKQRGLSADDRAYLLQCAARMWSFFDTFCTATDHFLPPDNWQEQPDERLAHRSSPTNIGLCLLSALAALDLGIATRENALGLIENVLATLRRLPKWNGNLYNWYDTQTLKPLHPTYVSTVDSGNLIACLITLRQGLLELGEQRLARDCALLSDAMELAPLYDKSRGLFSIGYDAEKGALSSGCYDLMASEARITSFAAVARGDVPRRHWRRLSRALAEQRDYRGLVSWTGSMFEYMMPRLFFPSERGSLIYESERFCVGVQKNRTRTRKLPWGISESAYFSLDASLSYRYKAHGCAALALKRGMDQELVVSPYSSFLALPCSPRAAVRNLRELEAFGLSCAYGFWEAIDFTPERSDRPGGQLVRCVMAHHLGMSILAVCNALCMDAMPRRLMSAPEMSAHAVLLSERLPLNGGIIHRKEKRAPERPARGGAVYWERRGDYFEPSSPVCCVLSNGIYSLTVTDGGVSLPAYRGIAPYYSPADAPALTHGIDLYLSRGEALIPLLPSNDLPEAAKSDWEFRFSGAKICTERDGLRAQVVYTVPSDAQGEKRVISVSPDDGTEEQCRLIITLEPTLLPTRDYDAHPAFAKLGLHAKMRGGALIIRRLARGDTPETYMCLAASEPLECSARRGCIPGRGGLAAAVKNLPSPLGWLDDPFICAALPLRLADGADSAVSLALTVGGSENEVYSSACRVLTGNGESAEFPGEAAARCGLSERETDRAMQQISDLRYPAAPNNALSRSALWKYGISGDYPLRTLRITGEKDLPDAEEAAKTLSFLCAVGTPFDLALICDEGGDYLRPLAEALSSLRKRLGEHGRHFHIIENISDADILESFSVRPRERGMERRSISALSEKLNAPAQEKTRYEFMPDGSFRFEADGSLPPRAWCSILTNGRFSFIASESFTGNMWYKNAREYSINRRVRGVRDTRGSETLELCQSSGRASLFATPDGDGCTVSYGFGFAQWEKTLGGELYTTTAYVPKSTDARVITVRWEGGGKRRFAWYSDLVLGSERPEGLTLTREEGAFRIHAPSAPFEEADFIVCSNAAVSSYTASRTAWLRGEPKDEKQPCDGLGIIFEADSPFVLVCGCDDSETLCELCRPAHALSALEGTALHWQHTVSALTLTSPLPALDRLINGWLPYQIIACRLLARSSIYQSGGAIGFRDQLQDAVNIILCDASFARSQILDCCRHQYVEGDVMHWWHALDTGTRGVRTHCSDDLLWLPWALCEYTEKTGDTTLCSVQTPWLASSPLEAFEHDRYESAVPTEKLSTVFEHSKAALDLVIKRGTGSNGLLKIGGGDWNDGFSAVGSGGFGESVWLSWFFAHTAVRFAALSRRLGREEEAEKYEQSAERIGKAANDSWSGEWYLRGYFDDGTPLGFYKNESCQIDSIAQSFAALCPQADKDRVNTALSNAVARLFDREAKLIRLFDPPFETSLPYPGYIQSYGPGFRENGGQYTHAAVWLIMALLLQNRRSEALALIEALLPELHESAVYESEPFVLAADVYSNPDCLAAAGWSWYTGAAGWLYRVVTEELLGLKLQDGALTLSPRLPREWDNCTVRLRSHDGSISCIELTSGGSMPSPTEK